MDNAYVDNLICGESELARRSSVSVSLSGWTVAFALIKFKQWSVSYNSDHCLFFLFNTQEIFTIQQGQPLHNRYFFELSVICSNIPILSIKSFSTGERVSSSRFLYLSYSA